MTTGDYWFGSSDYLYRDGQWSRITLPWPEDGGTDRQLMEHFGFGGEEEFQIGLNTDYLWASVHRREKLNAPGEFAVVVNSQIGGNYVVCGGLPDLLSLLGQLRGIIDSVRQTQIREEAAER